MDINLNIWDPYLVAYLSHERDKYGLREWLWVASFRNYGKAYHYTRGRLDPIDWLVFKWGIDPFMIKCDYLYPNVPLGAERIKGIS